MHIRESLTAPCKCCGVQVNVKARGFFKLKNSCFFTIYQNNRARPNTGKNSSCDHELHYSGRDLLFITRLGLVSLFARCLKKNQKEDSYKLC